MANKLKYKERKNRYYCVECEQDSIDHKPTNTSQEVYRRCRVCKKDCLFAPLDSDNNG
jgi:hypothetical protein